jgi:hypothetical protein
LYDDDGSPYYGNPSLKIVQREHPSFFNQPAKPSSDCSNVEPALKGDHFLAAMIGSYMNSKLPYTFAFDKMALFADSPF